VVGVTGVVASGVTSVMMVSVVSGEAEVTSVGPASVVLGLIGTSSVEVLIPEVVTDPAVKLLDKVVLGTSGALVVLDSVEAIKVEELPSVELDVVTAVLEVELRVMGVTVVSTWLGKSSKSSTTVLLLLSFGLSGSS